MASVYVFRFFLFFHFVLVLSAGHGNGKHDKCPTSFECGQFGSLHFPFTKPELEHCGFITIHGCDDDPSSFKAIQLEKNGKLLPLTNVVQQENLITVFDRDLHTTCEVFNSNKSLPLNSPLASFHLKHKVNLFRCNHDLHIIPPAGFINHVCPEFDVFCHDLHLPPPPPILGQPQTSLAACLSLQLPCKNLTYTTDFSSFSCGEIDIEVQLFDDCDECYNLKGGQCLVDNHNNFYCDIETGSGLFKWELGLGLGGLFMGLIGILTIIWWLLKQHYKQKYASSSVQMQSTNNNAIGPNSDTDLESGRYFGIRLFSYEELEKATNNFDCSRQLRNGGLSSVYYGKLQDGREVAIKRLYNKNYRRLEQFINEVEIFARLRHQNLVSLYGCTSHHSRELLLVYEYVPNSTVSFHLHGELANLGLLTWRVRMKIAIETATALAYLHASDIIHCDVKTDNILLGNNLCVKVAGFGLSRLSLIHVTHFSTTSQGTPGYIDPESNQGQQLTSKSDVYSFGVVLIELISSMPAVDMSRPKEEIILTNLAIKKIQKNAIKEFVDPSLGFASSNEIRRMIVLVAELAFQCLQRDKELRPSMYEVLEILIRIESGTEELNCPEEVNNHGVTGTLHSGMPHSPSPRSPDNDEAMLLKNI